MFQEMWTYAHIKRRELEERENQQSLARLVCSFINPDMAKKIFTDTESSDSSGFLDDLKSIDPNFNMDDYEDALEADLSE